MSVVHAVQWEAERWHGVPLEVTEVVRALREGNERKDGTALKGLTGRYETAYGLTDPVEILKGLGQGCGASPTRSKPLLALIAGAVDRACAGASVEGRKERVGTLFFADDGAMMTDNIQELQRAFEAIWMVTRVAGLKMQFLYVVCHHGPVICDE